jgi:anti-sigma factor RsiW
MMDCRHFRERLLDLVAGRLDPAETAAAWAHIEGCADCMPAARIEEELNHALRRLSHHRAPRDLRQRIEEMVVQASTADTPDAVGRNDSAETPSAASLAAGLPSTAPSPSAASQWTALPPTADVIVEAAARTRRPKGPWAWPWSAALLGAGLAAALTLAVTGFGLTRAAADPRSELTREAVNDHLRVVNSVRPVEIESGGIHQVKPWFTGRLEFAPRVTFSGDADFPLLGGSVGYFRDRKAAVFVFKRRLHTITLLVFTHDGLPWPNNGLKRVGPLSVAQDSSRGFSLLFWRTGDLGYVLVSDVNRNDLEALATRLDRE